MHPCKTLKRGRLLNKRARYDKLTVDAFQKEKLEKQCKKLFYDMKGNRNYES